jgi:hypothetical protein
MGKMRELAENTMVRLLDQHLHNGPHMMAPHCPVEDDLLQQCKCKAQRRMSIPWLPVGHTQLPDFHSNAHCQETRIAALNT